MSHFGIGIFKPKTDHNIGSLWRSAYILGASYIFTIDGKYKKQASDVLKSWNEIPLYNYKSFEDFYNTLPYTSMLVGVEMTEKAIPLYDFEHPFNATYLLGSEDNGLPISIIEKCHALVKLKGSQSLNVANTGSIVLHDRVSKLDSILPDVIPKTKKYRS